MEKLLKVSCATAVVAVAAVAAVVAVAARRIDISEAIDRKI